jgi:hypothetical protein
MPESDGWRVHPGLGEPLACSDWARSQHLNPVGSAGYYDGFLLIEQPLPWPFDVSSLPELVAVAEVAASARLRLQTVIPVRDQGLPPPSPEDDGDEAELPGPPRETKLIHSIRRLICYRSVRPGWAGPLVRSERVVQAGALATAVADLVDHGPALDEAGSNGTRVVDLLVCTHGRRDACCGARGRELLSELRGHAGFSSEAGMRLWRTSHTGGHRFAPTAILLPAGTMWAWADASLLRAAASAEGEVGPWLERYRGCATVGSPAQQALERAVAAEVGWPLMGSYRRASDLADGVVRLESEPGGVWEAVVHEGRRVPQPDCRTSPDLATKQSVEWVVEGLRQVVPA